MTMFKTVAVAAALTIGAASLAMAQNGPATGGNAPAAGGSGNSSMGSGKTGDTGAMNKSTMDKKKDNNK